MDNKARQQAQISAARVVVRVLNKPAVLRSKNVMWYKNAPHDMLRSGAVVLVYMNHS